MHGSMFYQKIGLYQKLIKKKCLEDVSMDLFSTREGESLAESFPGFRHVQRFASELFL